VGVLITDVADSSPAWRYGLRPGDVVVGVNRKSVRNLADFSDSAMRGAQMLLRVYRNGEYGYISLR
jgi:serine protease Do/serine protease DegQ